VRGRQVYYTPASYSIGHYKKSLSSFVAGFKSTVTRRVNLLRGTPQQTVWQRSFYDHIIRNEKSLAEIRKYIADNPLNWEMDENNIN
jgi:putative transposase